MALNPIQAVDAATTASQRPVQEADQAALSQLVAAVSELQRLRVAVVAGAAANTAIAVAGIAANDTLLAVLELAAPEEAAGTVAVFDRTAQSAPGAGSITVTVATNTNAQRRLVVLFYDKN